MKTLATCLLVVLPISGSANADLIINAASDSNMGEQIYRSGLLMDGSAVKATLADVVPIDGSLFACANCHQRSGMGSVEGSVVAWPMTGNYLYEPRRRTGAWHSTSPRKQLPEQFKAEDARPAFTPETLAHAIRTGELPNGQRLSRAMPRYQLDDENMQALIGYLESLSTQPDPGVTETTIRFATIVSEGVAPNKRKAMLDVLQAIAKAHSVQTRPHKRRAKFGPFYKTQSYGAYREMKLDIWELTGSRDTWPEQLHDLYEQQPVFALLGGIVEDDWSPVHEFSESMKIPTIFPVTDRPVVSDSDWYTLYLSKGHGQEGIAAARYLSTLDNVSKVDLVHIYRNGSIGNTIADSFDQEWKLYNDQSARHIVLQETEPTAKAIELVTSLLSNRPNSKSYTLLLWLNADEIELLLPVIEPMVTKEIRLVASAKLLSYESERIPESLSAQFLFTLPKALPNENANRYRAVQQWLRIREIPVTDLDIQAHIYFLGWLMPGVLKSMRGEYLRDYFLESFDMMTDQDTAIAVYPEVTFGPAQRYASKGCYIARLEFSSDSASNESYDDLSAEWVPVTPWIIH